MFLFARKIITHYNFSKTNAKSLILSVIEASTLDDCLAFKYAREDIFNILMASVICLHFGMQEEGILAHTNGKCHLCTL